MTKYISRHKMGEAPTPTDLPVLCQFTVVPCYPPQPLPGFLPVAQLQVALAQVEPVRTVEPGIHCMYQRKDEVYMYSRMCESEKYLSRQPQSEIGPAGRRREMRQQTTPTPGVNPEADLFIAGVRRSGKDDFGSLLHVPRHRGHTVAPGGVCGGAGSTAG